MRLCLRGLPTRTWHHHVLLPLNRRLLDYEEPNHFAYLFGAYKYDLQTRTYKEQLWGERGRFFGGECSFVPRPGATAEDDGYLLTLVNDVRQQRTELRVYDAANFGNPGCEPLAKIVCPRRVIPLGTHGLWLTEDQVNSTINVLEK